MASKQVTAPKSLGRALNFAASAGNAVANGLLAADGLGLAQWAVLMSIWHNGPLTVKQIAEVTGNAPPAASRIVDRMVQGGLLERRPHARDRRAVVVDVTDKGEGLRPLARVYRDVTAVLASDLSHEEVEQLFDLLARVEAAGRTWLAGDRGRGKGPDALDAGDGT